MGLLRTRVLDAIDRVRTSYWFVPGGMVALGVLASWAMVAFDRSVGWDAEKLPWVRSTSPSSAHLLLSTLAGSLITLAGVVFSITIVALTLASSQFGPRLMRGFMRDRTTQFTLGTFTATFVYCLLVLYEVDGSEDSPFAPRFAVFLGVIMAVVSVLVLIGFIHHVSSSIHVGSVIREVACELEAHLDEPFPSSLGRDLDLGADELDTLLERFDGPDACTIDANCAGYVRVLNGERLLELAVEHDWRVLVRAMPGRFLLEGLPAFVLLGGPPGDDEREALLDCLAVGSQRTTVQDLRFSLDQLVEVALRALSPGVNDPFTAVACVHRLGQSLSKLARADRGLETRADDLGQLRLVLPQPGLGGLLYATYRPICGQSASPLLRTAVERTLADLRCVVERGEVDRAIERLAEEFELDVPGQSARTGAYGEGLTPR